MDKASSIVLDYVYSKENHLILSENLLNTHVPFITDSFIEKNIDEIVGQNLNLLDLSFKLLIH